MSASRGNLALRLPEGAPFAPEERTALDGILGRASLSLASGSMLASAKLRDCSRVCRVIAFCSRKHPCMVQTRRAPSRVHAEFATAPRKAYNMSLCATKPHRCAANRGNV